MSYAKEDWKVFFQISHKMNIGDLTKDSHIVNNVALGKWMGAAEYGKDNQIRRVILAKDGMFQKAMEAIAHDEPLVLTREPFEQEEHIVQHSAGIYCIFDDKYVDEYPEEDIPLNSILLDKLGAPNDPEKDKRQSFIEAACHLSNQNHFKALGETRHGLFFNVDSDIKISTISMKDTLDVEMIEIVTEKNK